MKTVIPSRVRQAISSFPRRAILARQTGSVASVHAIESAPHDPEGPMFVRAVSQGSKAPTNRQSSIAARNHALSKQLFPSSSPGGSKDGNIADMVKQSRLAPGSSGGLAPAAKTTSEPLGTRSLNSVQPRPAQFAALLSNSDSFNEDPDSIGMAENGYMSLSGTTRVESTAQSVYFNDDDFSDIDDLDFDNDPAPPVVLPRTQQPPVPVPRPQYGREPPPPTTSSAISWSQSSPSHYQQPKAAKRESPSDSAAVYQAAKKIKRELASHESAKQVKREPVRRELPPSFKKKQENEEEQHKVFGAINPPSKAKKEHAFLNMSATEAKAQRKQLKTQHKAAAEHPDSMLEDTHEAMVSHSKRGSKTAAIKLSAEQEYVKELVVDRGRSVFFTGPAGTGKSVLMRAIIAELKKKYARDPERVAVTASTGLAACNIGGMTLHSFSGIGLGKEDAAALVKKIRRNPKAKNRWLKTKVLIIDEISMVDGDLFDKLNQIAKTLRSNGRPWGGIQLVITGDFFQLPPVPDGSKQRDIKFAFEGVTWGVSLDHTIGLKQVFRQKDPEFAEMLNEMRLGKITERTVKSFQALSRPLHFNDGLEVTELFPTRNEVDNSNRIRLQALPGKSRYFPAVDKGSDPTLRDRLLANMMAPPSLELKKGAQVMLIKNMDDTLVNGSLGTVQGFMNEATFNLKGGLMDGDDAADAETDKKRKRIQAFTNALEGSADDQEYPLVHFRAMDGSERQLLCVPEDWKVELPTGEVQAERKQLPLILAWALSIHKAQGQTLDRVKVDLGKVFEKGQAYVALSRATSQQGLQVLRFDKNRVMAHHRVIDFYNNLTSANEAAMKKASSSLASFVTRQPSLKADSSVKRDAKGPRAKEAQKVVIDLVEEEELAAAYG